MHSSFRVLTPESNHSPESVISFYQHTRAHSEKLIESLSAEDCLLQSMPDVSPAKWHLAHTSWFFETLVIKVHLKDYQPINKHYEFLFNSYYNSIGEQFSRAQRSLLSRPSLSEVIKYRHFIDQQMLDLLSNNDSAHYEQIKAVTLLGIHHEKQHQELLLMDIKHAFSINPMHPSYATQAAMPIQQTTSTATSDITTWDEFEQGIYSIGTNLSDEFCFDNETPKHQQLINGFKLCSSLVTNGEYLAFIQDAGYQQAMHWLSDGWSFINQQALQHPLYWRQIDGQWFEFTLYGLQALDLQAPLCHINYYEANAYASWKQKRLPTEFEWEVASKKQLNKQPATGLTTNPQGLHPNTKTTDPYQQYFHQTWQWTSSAYASYPGFKPLAGAAGEYNGKFMSNQFVLRGGCCLSPDLHIRNSYRNFFYPHQAWMMSGLRLAEDLS